MTISGGFRLVEGREGCGTGHHGAVEVAELVLKYVRVLVWPVVTLVLVWSLRAQLRAALTRMTRVETPAGAIEFAAEAREVLDQAQGAADAAPPALPVPPLPGPPLPSAEWPAPYPREEPEPVPVGDASAGGAYAGDAALGETAEETEPVGDEEPATPVTPPDERPVPQPAGPWGGYQGQGYDQDFRLAPPLPSGHQPQQPYGQPQPYAQFPFYGQQQPQPYAQSQSYGYQSPPGSSRAPWQEKLREARGMSEVSPVGAVVTAWNALERLCLDVLEGGPVAPPRAGSTVEMGFALAAVGLSPGALDVYERLRVLRDRAVHGAGDVTAGAARDFVDSCRAVGREVAALRRG